jgi:hypothetical protein
MEEMINSCKMLVLKPEGKRLHGRLGTERKKILECMCTGEVWTGFIWLRTGTSGGLL